MYKFSVILFSTFLYLLVLSGPFSVLLGLVFKILFESLYLLIEFKSIYIYCNYGYYRTCFCQTIFVYFYHISFFSLFYFLWLEVHFLNIGGKVIFCIFILLLVT